MKRWYDFRAQAKGAEIVIYDEIGAFGIPAKTFLDELKALGPVAELTVRINSPGGSVFDGVAIYNALKRCGGHCVDRRHRRFDRQHDRDGGRRGRDARKRHAGAARPVGAGRRHGHRHAAMAEALDRMKAGMVAAYRDKSGRGNAEIEALLAAETWLSAQEAVALGLADRVEEPVKMAAHFDLSRFRNLPPHLAATLTSSKPQEDEMSDSHKTRPRRADPDPPATAQVPVHEADPNAGDADGMAARHAVEVARPEPAPAPGAAPQPAAAGTARPAPPPATAQVIDLDAVRADERKATLAYVSEVHELCALAARGDLAANFIAKATPVAQIRRALLEARAAEDEATAIRSQVRPATVEPAQPAIDTAAIYAARNQHCR